MSGFGLVREKVEGGPADDDYELEDDVYNGFVERAKKIKSGGVNPTYLSDLREAFERARNGISA